MQVVALAFELANDGVRERTTSAVQTELLYICERVLSTVAQLKTVGQGDAVQALAWTNGHDVPGVSQSLPTAWLMADAPKGSPTL